MFSSAFNEIPRIVCSAESLVELTKQISRGPSQVSRVRTLYHSVQLNRLWPLHSFPPRVVRAAASD
jgi:hypothetical protein